MNTNPRRFWTKGISNSELAITAPHEYCSVRLSVKERISFPPKRPTDGLKRMPTAPAQIRIMAHRYRNGARENFTTGTLPHLLGKGNAIRGIFPIAFAFNIRSFCVPSRPSTSSTNPQRGRSRCSDLMSSFWFCSSPPRTDRRRKPLALSNSRGEDTSRQNNGAKQMGFRSAGINRTKRSI